MSSIAPPFNALEVTVIALARSEHGRGIPSSNPLARAFGRLRAWLNPDDRIRPLADPRLEALRLFVNTIDRRGGTRAEDLAAFLAAGFSKGHLPRLLGNRAFAR